MINDDDAHQAAPTSLSSPSSLLPVSSSPCVVKCFVHQSTPNHAVVLSTVSSLFMKKASTSSSTTANTSDTSYDDSVRLKDLYSAVLRCLPDNTGNDAAPPPLASYAVYATCCVSNGRVQHPPFLLPSSDELTPRNGAMSCFASESIASLCMPFVDVKHYRGAPSTTIGSSTKTMISVSISVLCKESGVSSKGVSRASPTFCSQPERRPDPDENALSDDERYQDTVAYRRGARGAFLRDAVRGGASARGRGRGGTYDFDLHNDMYGYGGEHYDGGRGRGGRGHGRFCIPDSDSSSDDDMGTPEWIPQSHDRGGRGRGGRGRVRGPKKAPTLIEGW